MKMRFWAVLFYESILLSGCGLQVGTDFLAGRHAFLIGDNETALAYFNSAAKGDPNYKYGTRLPQNIWSYVGRAEYAAGRFPQARAALEKALSMNQREDIARLYLGLSLARSGDRQQGLREIESGLRGIHDQLEYITMTDRFYSGRFWDPRREIRSEIESTLRMLSGRDVDVQKIIENGEWIGRKTEEEIDRVRQDETIDFRRRTGDGQ
jgi:tetratricopeptide (TPR) repeat protein